MTRKEMIPAGCSAIWLGDDRPSKDIRAQGVVLKKLEDIGVRSRVDLVLHRVAGKGGERVRLLALRSNMSYRINLPSAQTMKTMKETFGFTEDAKWYPDLGQCFWSTSRYIR